MSPDSRTERALARLAASRAALSDRLGPSRPQDAAPGSAWIAGHPRLALVIAASAGAAFVTTRPWRSAFVRRLARNLPREFARWAGPLLLQAPLQSWLADRLHAGLREVAQKGETHVH